MMTLKQAMRRAVLVNGLSNKRLRRIAYDPASPNVHRLMAIRELKDRKETQR